MSESEVSMKFSPKSLLVGLLLLLAFFGLKLMTFGELTDPDIKAALEERLAKEGEDSAKKNSKEKKYKIHSVTTSEPLFEMSTHSEPVLKVDRTLKDSSRGIVYYEVRRKKKGNRLKLYNSSKLGYYSNFF